MLASASIACASPFKPKELAQLLHAFGVAGAAPAGWAQHAWGACADVLPHFQPHELAIVLWSLARLRHSPGDEALRRAAEQLAARADDCDMQALSNAAWALAVLSKQPQPAAPLASLVRRAQALLPQSASPQALSNLLWALAKLGHDPGAAFVTACVARALALDAGLRCVRGGGQARVVCACARACVFAASKCCCLRCAFSVASERRPHTQPTGPPTWRNCASASSPLTTPPDRARWTRWRLRWTRSCRRAARRSWPPSRSRWTAWASTRPRRWRSASRSAPPA